jgi:hypothetical protein
MLTSGQRKAVAALKKLDTIAAAALVGLAFAPLAPAYLCAEASCSSAFDVIVFHGVGLIAALAAGLIFWRASRWWPRMLALAGALSLSYLLPIGLGRHGRWMVPLQSGMSCIARAGDSRHEVWRACGRATYWCDGPKYIDSGDQWWNPLSIVVCGFSGDVYENRFVTYNCRGRVARVTGFDGGPPERSRPDHCVTWGRKLDCRRVAT